MGPGSLCCLSQSAGCCNTTREGSFSQSPCLALPWPALPCPLPCGCRRRPPAPGSRCAACTSACCGAWSTGRGAGPSECWSLRRSWCDAPHGCRGRGGKSVSSANDACLGVGNWQLTGCRGAAFSQLQGTATPGGYVSWRIEKSFRLFLQYLPLVNIHVSGMLWPITDCSIRLRPCHSCPAHLNQNSRRAW